MKSNKEKVANVKNEKSDSKNKLKTIGYIVFFLILLGLLLVIANSTFNLIGDARLYENGDLNKGIKPGTPVEYDY